MAPAAHPTESDLVRKLREHEHAWTSKAFLRGLYRDWYQLMAGALSTADGPTVELGSGLGSFREFAPSAILTDIEVTPWADAVVDAENLPYEDGSLANLVMLDVFHHIPRPDRFLDEARRTLRAGGRIVLVEPYCSPFSTLVYRFGHHETLDMGADPFGPAPHSSEDAMDANIGLSTLAFFKNRRRLLERWPEFSIIEARPLSVVGLPLSGGFSKRQVVPSASFPLVQRIERLLQPVAPLAAFRCFVVVER